MTIAQKNNKKIFFTIAIIAVIFISVKIIPLIDTDTDKIRRIIYAAKQAIEKEELIKCMSFISYSYNDKDANNRATLFRIAKKVFDTYDNLLIEIVDLDISIVDKLNAFAHIICAGEGRRANSLILDTQKVEFEVIFQKETRGWKVVELKFIEPKNFLQLLKSI